MLSLQVITRKLGKDILVYPFDEKKLKGVGYNLSVGSFGWSLKHKEMLKNSSDNKYFKVEAGDTALIMTKETIWVSKRIGGTFHSKVDRVSEGFSSVSTTLDPEWIGPLLIAMTNLSGNTIELRKDDSISTLIFYNIEKSRIPLTQNLSGRIDRLNALRIHIEKEASEWLDEEFRKNSHALKEKILSEKVYDGIKKKYKKINFIKAYILPWLPSIFVFFSLLYAFTHMAPSQQLGPFIAAIAAAVAAIGIGLQNMNRQ